MFVQDQAGDTTLDLIKRSSSKSFRDAFRLYLGVGIPATIVYQDIALFQAAETGDMLTVKRLLSEGTDPLIVNPDGLSALSLAVSGGHVLAVDALLHFNGKAQMFLKNSSSGETALHLAVQMEKKDLVKRLLNFSPDLEDRQNDGKTAFFLAVELGNKRLIKTLLNRVHGAQVFTQCHQGNTPLHHSVCSSLELLALILDAENSSKCLEHRNQYGQTPVWLAIRHESFEAFRMLKERGASLRTANNDHDNLLHLIARQNLYDFLSRNLSIFDPSDIERRNRWNDTPLTIADRNGSREIAGLLRSFYMGVKISNMADIVEVPSEKPKLFYTLGSDEKWIREDSAGYWRHLTYESYKVYEQIWYLATRDGAKRLQCNYH